MIEFFVPVKPIPASRARISKFGNYYGKNYTEFRKQAYRFLKKIRDKYPTKKGSFFVDLEFICYRPQNPTNDYPRGDIDNYVKSITDSITYANMIWEDDVQMVTIHATKRYQEEGEDYGINVRVCEI